MEGLSNLTRNHLYKGACLHLSCELNSAGSGRHD